MTACTHIDCLYTGPCRHKEDRSVTNPFAIPPLTPEQQHQVAEQAGSRFETKDSGARVEFDSGMVRDTEEGKARFDLLLPKGVPYREQMLTRFAELMARGAGKYGDRNWEKARGQVELDRYHSSALRHLQQWVNGETDEDHAAAVMFNIVAGETVKWKMRVDRDGDC